MFLRPNLFRSAAPLSLSSLRCRPAIMPLRSKILNPEIAGKRLMATHLEMPKEEPGDEPDDVLFNTAYGVRTVELNRPKKLNSLNGSMARKIIPRLREWEKSDMANVIIMKGAGEKALCAGGDVAALAELNKQGPEGQQKSKDYFAVEYRLDHLIATYTKPYVAFMDGITMGGGVGLSVHAPFRIATERTMFAMPETTIGFFPEVGASFFLPRMDGALGTYLALTSERLQGVQTLYHGIATHYIHSSSLPDLENRLGELQFQDSASMMDRCKSINSTIEEFVTGLPFDQPIHLAGDLRKAIDECFSHASIEEILSSLEKVQKGNNDLSEWAKKTLSTIHDRSPTSVKVTLREMQLGKDWSIDVAFQREHLIAGHFMEHHDFIEGVGAQITAKPKRKGNWKPATLEEVSNDDVDSFFRLPPGSEKLKLYSEGPAAEYTQYPHAWISIPTEEEVKAYVKKVPKSQGVIVEHFVKSRNGKQGVKEVVQEILQRKTSQQSDGCVWVD